MNAGCVGNKSLFCVLVGLLSNVTHIDVGEQYKRADSQPYIIVNAKQLALEDC